MSTLELLFFSSGCSWMGVSANPQSVSTIFGSEKRRSFVTVVLSNNNNNNNKQEQDEEWAEFPLSIHSDAEVDAAHAVLPQWVKRIGSFQSAARGRISAIDRAEYKQVDGKVGADVIVALRAVDRVEAMEEEMLCRVAQRKLLDTPVKAGVYLRLPYLGRDVLFRVEGIRGEAVGGYMWVEKTTRIRITSALGYPMQLEVSLGETELDQYCTQVESLVETIVSGQQLASSSLPIPSMLLVCGLRGCGKSAVLRHLIQRCKERDKLHVLELSGNNLLATSQQGPSTATDLCLKLLLVFDRLKRSIRKQPSVVVLDDMSAIIENSEKPSPIAQKIRRLLIDTIQRAREEKLPVCWVAAVGDSDQIPAAVHSMAKATTVPPLSLTSRMVLFARMISRAGKHFPLAEQPEEASVIRRIQLDDIDEKIRCKLEAIPKPILQSALDLALDSPAFQLRDIAEAVRSGNRVLSRNLDSGIMFDVERPSVSLDDIGGYEEIKRKLALLSAQWTFDKAAERIGVKKVGGVMFAGPSGCGKTMMARALAGQGALNLLTIKGSDVFSKWVGESERQLRSFFRIGSSLAPCLLFFDEIDSLTPARSRDQMSTAVDLRVLATLLTELDGVEERKGVFVCGASSRLDEVDPALLRPGRFDVLINVDLPYTVEERLDILRVCTRRMSLDKDVDLQQLARATSGKSGASLRLLCQEAAIKALRENLRASSVSWRHFQQVLG